LATICLRNALQPRIGQFLGKSDAGDRIVANSDDVIHRNLEDLDSFDELVKSQGARLILVYIPFRRDIPELSRSSASILTAWCGARHVGIFDLTSAEAPYSAKKITLDNGVHLNARCDRSSVRAILARGDWEMGADGLKVLALPGSDCGP
jgi:hypothetical protein